MRGAGAGPDNLWTFLGARLWDQREKTEGVKDVLWALRGSFPGSLKCQGSSAGLEQRNGTKGLPFSPEMGWGQGPPPVGGLGPEPGVGEARYLRLCE